MGVQTKAGLCECEHPEPTPVSTLNTSSSPAPHPYTPSSSPHPITHTGPRHCLSQASPLPWGSRSQHYLLPTTTTSCASPSKELSSPRRYPPHLGDTGPPSSGTPRAWGGVGRGGGGSGALGQASTHHPVGAPESSPHSRDWASRHQNLKGYPMLPQPYSVCSEFTQPHTLSLRYTPTPAQSHRHPLAVHTLSHIDIPVTHSLSLIHIYSQTHNPTGTSPLLGYTLTQAQTAFHSVPGETLKSEVNLLRERVKRFFHPH